MKRLIIFMLLALITLSAFTIVSYGSDNGSSSEGGSVNSPNHIRRTPLPDPQGEAFEVPKDSGASNSFGSIAFMVVIFGAALFFVIDGILKFIFNSKRNAEEKNK